MITSRELAKELGKQHSNVKVSIRRAFGSDVRSVKSCEFTHLGNRYFEYHLTDEQEDIARERLTKKTTHNQIIEPIALSTIEQILGITLKRQYRVGKYRIDGFDEQNNTAYEIDEEHHYLGDGTLNPKCVKRQKDIQKQIKCKFIRVKL